LARCDSRNPRKQVEEEAAMSKSAKKKAKPRKAIAPKKTKAKVTRPKKVEKVIRAKEEKPKKAAPKTKPVVAEKKEAPVKPVAKTISKPISKPEPLKLGPPPMAIVATRHVDSDSLHERQARGFSFGELSSAGVPLNAAKDHDLSVDVRRRSVVDKNVETLKGWLEPVAQKK
jgi:ribosomal protein L13E